MVEARRGTTVVWRADLEGSAGPISVGGAAGAATVFVALGGTGSLAGAAVRGEPASAIVALDTATGVVRWRRAIEPSEWSLIGGLAASPDGGIVIGGSFSGSLRADARVVSSAGRSDGFIAKLTGAGAVTWLVRVGGLGADAVQGVAVRDARIAIAGTVAPGAELHGAVLPAFDERTPYADGFVAELDASGARVWSATFGGKLDDSVAGVAIDASGRIAIAGNARDTVHVGGADLVAQGPSDGVVAWWTKEGVASHAVLLGGLDFDGLRAITSVGDRIVVGGFFSGSLRLGDRTLTAGGGDDAFLATLDDHGAVLDSTSIGGPGREEISALSAFPGGIIAGVGHTAAAELGGVHVDAPKDPLSGAALVIRPVP